MTAAALRAHAAWRTLDFISDLHLQACHRGTFEAWKAWMLATPAQAIFILGDLFEVWVGDDVALPGSFEAECMAVLREAAQTRSIFVMHGNRDFLLGADFAAQSHAALLTDPTNLEFAGQHWLLSHGDAWCLADVDYQNFRLQVRSPNWQQHFLAQPLEKRRAIAHDLRQQSEQRKHRLPAADWADVDTTTARQALQQTGARTLIHGHTHRPADHDLGDRLQRVVLSDWDANALPPRLQVLRLTAQGLQRHPLAPDAGHEFEYTPGRTTPD
jgi:UDP-2,3-diacylglucosamine hydrolase